jgi:zinc protease
MRKQVVGIFVGAVMAAMSGTAKAESGSRWTFVTERDPQAQVALVRVLVRSGSLSDPAGLPGLANFTGRGLLRGTLTRPYAELTAAIERLGASVSVRVDQDITVIQGSVLVRNFDPFLDLLRDVLTQPAFDPVEMATLQKTLQGELRASLQDPEELASRAVLASAYAGTAADHVAEGTADGIGRARPQDLLAFYRAHYGSRNMLVGLVTPFEDDDARGRVERRLSAVPEGGLDAPALPAPAGLHARRAVIVHREGLGTTPIYVVAPGIGDADTAAPSLDVGNFVFGGDFTSRLMQVLRAEHGWTYGVSSSYRQLLNPKRNPGLFSIYLFPSSDHAADALPVTISMLEEYVQKGLNSEEFVKAREALGNAYPFDVATAELRLLMRLREQLTGRPYLDAGQYSSLLQGLSLESVNRTIAAKTPVQDLLIVAVGDEKVLKPLLAKLPGVKSVEVVEPLP